MADFVEVLNQNTVVIEDAEISVVSIAAQGPPGVTGPRGLIGPPGGAAFEQIAGSVLSGHRIVLLNAVGQMEYASNSTLAHAHRVIGMTTGAVAAGQPGSVRNSGELTEPGWAWDTTAPVYLGADGLLTQIMPIAPGAKFSLVVGFPISSTALFINIREPIFLS